MWTRAELKSNAKEVLRYSYWNGVLVVLIMGAITYVASLVTAFIPLGPVAASIFLSMPLMVGMYFYFLRSNTQPKEINNLFFSFNGGRYMKIVGAMAWLLLFTFLWSLIPISGAAFFVSSMVITSVTTSSMMTHATDYFTKFDVNAFNAIWAVVIPAVVIYIAGMVVVIIKSISYSMTPYILADNPFIGYQRALKLSIAMTHGHKGAIFVLALSFIGWGILAVLALGIGLLFLTPYIQGTYAQLYLKLREIAIQNGIATREELTDPYGY